MRGRRNKKRPAPPEQFWRVTKTDDQIITYWKQDRAGGLLRIIREGLGIMMTELMDFHARNAFLQGALLGGYSMFGRGTGVDFSDLTASDTITTALLDDIRLGMHERDVPYVADPDGPGGTMVLITTPGVVRDLQHEASQTGNANAFVDVMRYADATRIINGEVGTYHGFRIVQTPRAILYNVGPIITQKTITAALEEGDGAPHPGTTKVDGAYKVGQPSATHYVQLNSVSGLAVNDIVTIHVLRTNEFGVTNGVDFRDGKLHNRRIVSIDTGNNRIVLDKPVMQPFKTDLGGGVYGYVTKGSNVHTAIALGGQDGVVLGVAQPPRVYELDPIDDTRSIYRFTFDMYVGWQPFEPRVYEVWFGAGSNRVKGARYIR